MKWILDSGATRHMIGDLNLLTNVQDYLGFVTFGNNTSMQTTKIGTYNVLKDVLYIPQFKYKLLSIHQLAKQFGGEICLNDRYALFRKTCSDSYLELIIGERDPTSGLYLTAADFDMSKLVEEHCYASFLETEPSLTRTEKQELRLNNHWKVAHETYGHASISRLRQLRGKTKCFIPASPPTKFFCEVCARAKAHRTPKRDVLPEVPNGPDLEPLSKISSDVAGPFTTSVGLFKYYCLFIDKATRYRWVYFLKRKSEVFEKFKDFQAMLKRQFNRNMEVFKTDNGGEYNSDEFNEYLQRHGIEHEVSAPYSQWQNGIAERSNRTIKEMARAMMLAAHVPIILWHRAVAMAVHLLNRMPTSSLPDNGIPYEKLYSKSPPSDVIYPFGCDVYVFVQENARTVLEDTSKACYYLGPVDGSKDMFHYFNPVTKRPGISRDGIFKTDLQWTKTRPNLRIEDLDAIFGDNEPAVVVDKPIITPQPAPMANAEQNTADIHSVLDNLASVAGQTVEHEARQLRPPAWLRDYAYTSVLSDDVSKTEGVDDIACIISPDGQRTFTLAEVRKREDWPLFEEAMRVELEAMEKNETWEDAELPEGRTLVGYVWTFTIKQHENPPRYKARLCAQGFTQVHGMDYFETFSPVISQTSLRVLLSLAAANGWHLHQMDVHTAFLQGTIDAEIYMRRPSEINSDGKAPVVRLKKAIYGLKQSSRIFNDKINDFFINLGFTRSKAEPCLYTMGKGHQQIVIGVYVDDIVIAGADMDRVNWVKKCLSGEYPMKDIGPLKTILGMEVTRKGNTLSLGLKKYFDIIMKRFNMADAYPAAVPIDPNIKYSADMSDYIEEDATSTNELPYRQVLGALLYATQAVRLDGSYAVSKLARYMNNYNIAHWRGVQQLLRYFKGTTDIGITYNGKHDTNTNILEGYVDADWAADIDTRRSQTGYIFYLNGGPVSWQSKKQTTVALSTVEAEYMAMSAATQELLYLRQLLEDLGFPQRNATTLYEDNQGTMALATGRGGMAKRTKHIDIRHHFVKEKIAAAQLKIEYVPSALQRADIMTKGFAVAKFRELRELALGAEKVRRSPPAAGADKRPAKKQCRL